MSKKTVLLFSLIMASFLISSHAAEKASSFALRDLDGELVRLNDYTGEKVVLIDFWASWCKPCMQSMPKLQKVYEEFMEQGLVMLAINEDGPRSLSKVQPLVSSLGLTYQILLDENRDVARKYKVPGFPTTILIDKKGEVAMRVSGYRPGDENHLRQKIEELLKEEGAVN